MYVYLDLLPFSIYSHLSPNIFIYSFVKIVNFFFLLQMKQRDGVLKRKYTPKR